MKQFVLAFLTSFIVFSSFHKVQSQTPLQGIFSTDSTLSVSNSPYIVYSDSLVLIDTTATLTIEAGVEIFIEDGSILYAEGNIHALGTVSEPIHFVSSSPTWGSYILYLGRNYYDPEDSNGIVSTPDIFHHVNFGSASDIPTLTSEEIQIYSNRSSDINYCNFYLQGNGNLTFYTEYSYSYNSLVEIYNSDFHFLDSDGWAVDFIMSYSSFKADNNTFINHDLPLDDFMYGLTSSDAIKSNISVTNNVFEDIKWPIALLFYDTITTTICGNTFQNSQYAISYDLGDDQSTHDIQNNSFLNNEVNIDLGNCNDLVSNTFNIRENNFYNYENANFLIYFNASCQNLNGPFPNISTNYFGNLTTQNELDSSIVNSGSSTYTPSGDIIDQNLVSLFPFPTIGNCNDTSSGLVYVRGTVFIDKNTNCIKDTIEELLSSWIVRAESVNGTVYAMTNSNGAYLLPLSNVGSYTITAVLLNASMDYWGEGCTGLSQTVSLSNFGDTASIDFGIEPFIQCPALKVDVTAPFLRRCFPNYYTVNYCNIGTEAANNAYVDVELDPYLSVNFSSIPWTTQNGNTYTFDLGDISISQCGSFQIEALLDCDSTVLGQTHCVSAHIYPDSICLPASALWDESSLDIQASCEQNDSVKFVIFNKGVGDMNDTKMYYVIEDDIMFRYGDILLNSGDSLIIKEEANGATFRLLTEQSDFHPGDDRPTKAIEGCGSNNLGEFSLGYYTQFPENEYNSFVSIDCKENIGSYDPNKKEVYPKGYNNQSHFIYDDTKLEYIIHFQNTGTDTAFMVVIRDTLSQFVDPETIQLGAASHNYTFNMHENAILEWRFENIELPDSNIDQLGSMGFVTYSIDQADNISEGTVIENTAFIYFDFNDPIKTNTVFNTIASKFTQTDIQYVRSKNHSIRMYPNPTLNILFIESDSAEPGEDMTVSFYSTSGKLAYTFVMQNGNTIRIRNTEVIPGTYIVDIQKENVTIGSGKVIVE